MARSRSTKTRARKTGSGHLDLSPKLEALHLSDCRNHFESAIGDAKASALFGAIRFCGNQGIALPEWAVQAFFEATNAWFGLRAGSLDQAFGTSPVTDGRLAQRRRRLLLRVQVKNEMAKIKARGVPVDWPRLAGELGSTKTVVQDLYYGRKRNASKPLSRKRGRKSGMKT